MQVFGGAAVGQVSAMSFRDTRKSQWRLTILFDVAKIRKRLHEVVLAMDLLPGL